MCKLNANENMLEEIDHSRNRYPFCIVWTPIPLLTWLFPFLGHIGIALSSGIIRDFAGPYFVAEDDMAFGNPTKYLQLDVNLAKNGISGWDNGIVEAAEIYKSRMHNLCCDNCHSYVATALNIMEYNGKTNWNMVYVCFKLLINGKYVSFVGFVKTWLPFCLIVSILLGFLFLR